MQVKVVLQDGIKDCGICCLLSIIRYYGGEVSKEYLRELTNTTKNGVTLYNLAQAAKQIGFEAIGMSGDLTKIKNDNLPCLAHIIVNKNYKHFVVIYNIDHKNKQVILMDPAKGKKCISFAEFNLLSSNNFLFLRPYKNIPIIKKKNIILKSIYILFKIKKTDIIFFTTLTIIFFLLNILNSFHFKILLEYAIKFALIINIKLICFIFISINIFKLLANTLRTIILNKWLILFNQEMTLKTYKQLLFLPYLFYKNRSTGEVINRFKDLTIIKNYLAQLLCFLATDLISLFVFGYFIFKYQKDLALIIISLIIFMLFLILQNSNKKGKYLKTISKNEDYLNSSIIESISNVDTIKGSHLEKRLFDKFSLKYQNSLNDLYKYSLNNEKIIFIKNFFNDLLTIIIYSLGTYFVIKEKLSLAELIIYQSFYTYFLTASLHGLELLEKYPSFSNSLNRVEELFLIEEEKFQSHFYYLSYKLDGNISFTNLTYKIGNKYLFNNLNLVIKPGEKILLSGPSGSGKSTLVKLLLRYLEIPYGMVSISGIDINHYHLENIRQNITYVSANEYLFTDTLRNNICLYKDIKDEDFFQITKLTLVDEIIENPTDYNKVVEENGFNFSYGEKQRIIIARSLIRKSNIYIFDEALCGIDINKEKKILTNIFAFFKDKTIIVISHRFNNKKLFDHVLKLESGNIYEL